MDSVSICIYNSFKRVIDTEEYIKKNYTTDFFEWLSRLFGPAFGAGPTAWQFKANGKENCWGPKRTLRVRLAVQCFALKVRGTACCGASLWGVPLSAPRVLFHGDNQRIAIHVELIWTQAVIDFYDFAAVEFHVRDDIAEAVIPHLFKEFLR